MFGLNLFTINLGGNICYLQYCFLHPKYRSDFSISIFIENLVQRFEWIYSWTAKIFHIHKYIYTQAISKEKKIFRMKVTLILFLTLKFNFTIVKKQCKFITDLQRVVSYGDHLYFESSCFYDLKSIYETLGFGLLSVDKKDKKILMAFKILLFFLSWFIIL